MTVEIPEWLTEAMKRTADSFILALLGTSFAVIEARSRGEPYPTLQDLSEGLDKSMRETGVFLTPVRRTRVIAAMEKVIPILKGEINHACAS